MLTRPVLIASCYNTCPQWTWLLLRRLGILARAKHESAWAVRETQNALCAKKSWALGWGNAFSRSHCLLWQRGQFESDASSCKRWPPCTLRKFDIFMAPHFTKTEFIGVNDKPSEFHSHSDPFTSFSKAKLQTYHPRHNLTNSKTVFTCDIKWWRNVPVCAHLIEPGSMLCGSLLITS